MSRVLAIALGISFVIPFVVLFTLLALKVRLGQGYFAYRWSPVRELRAPRGFIAIAIGAIACAAVWVLARRRRRAPGLAALIAAFLMWGAWTFWGPPNALTQQLYGMTSPSTDGAFVVESLGVESVGTYLRGFDRGLNRSVEEMRGTRVLSNPPGMTIFARALGAVSLGRESLQRWLVQQEGVYPEDVPRLAESLRVGMALCLVWALSGIAAYGLGRVFLSPAGAAVFAIVVTFNPCAVEFVPGKDPAQLLTINAMLWAWFAGWKRKSLWLAALAGALLVLGAIFGLVHVWVAAIALVATLWEEKGGSATRPLREALSSRVTRVRGEHAPSSARSVRGVWSNCIATGCGALAVIGAVYLAIGWNIPSTLWAVSRRWSEIQKTFDMSRPIWFLVGLPIFLLFLSPGIYALAGLSIRRRRMNLGTRLVICTLAAMAIIYCGFGVTYELPRLWVAFLPTLALGLAIDRPLFRGSEKSHRPRVAVALALIAATQIAFTALHWTLFDVRETEYRLISQRYYH